MRLCVDNRFLFRKVTKSLYSISLSLLHSRRQLHSHTLTHTHLHTHARTHTQTLSEEWTIETTFVADVCISIYVWPEFSAFESYECVCVSVCVYVSVLTCIYKHGSNVFNFSCVISGNGSFCKWLYMCGRYARGGGRGGSTVRFTGKL